MDAKLFAWIIQFEAKKSQTLLNIERWGFSVNRIGNVFSSVSVDMALEQTINSDAKSCLKGIIAFADVSAAVNRCYIKVSMRSQIVK